MTIFSRIKVFLLS